MQALSYPKLAPWPLALVVLAHVAVVLGIAASRAVTPAQPLLPSLMVDLEPEAPAPVVPPEASPARPVRAAEPVAKPVAEPVAEQVAPHRERSPAPPVPVLAAPQPAPAAIDTVAQVAAPHAQAMAATAAPVAESVPAAQALDAHAPSAPSAPSATTQQPGGPQPVTTAPRFDASYLRNPKPAYPPLSRRLNEQGTVTLRVLVDAEGAAATVAIEQSSGFERLDKAAKSAVSRWVFTPARQGPQPVAAWVTVPLVFSLTE